MTEQTIDYALERGLSECEIANLFTGELAMPADPLPAPDFENVWAFEEDL